MFFTIILLVLSSSLSFATPTSLTQRFEKDQDCAFYTVSGPNTGHFQTHKFYDFRSITDPAGFLTSSGFVSDWSIQTWTKPISPISPVRMRNTKDNLFISESSLIHSSHRY